MTESRPLTSTERERLTPVLSQTDIPVCVTDVIESMDDVITLHGEASGWRSSERQIMLSSGAFEQLEDDQLRALLAHEIGHHRGNHPRQFRMAKTGLVVGAFLLLGAGLGGSIFLGPWVIGMWGVLLAGWMFLVIFGGAWLSRAMEFDADRRAIEMLGTTEPLEALIRPGVTPPPVGVRDRLVELCYPWPTADRRLASLDRLARSDLEHGCTSPRQDE